MLFSGEGQEKLLLCKCGGGGGGHYMKNKNIGGCVLSTQPDQQKGPNAKKRKQLFNIEKSFLARFAHSVFYKIHIPEAANRHAPVQYAEYVAFFFFFFFGGGGGGGGAFF